MDQLADNTNEESIILTANITDGTLSHIGSSDLARGFLEEYEDVRSQFLSYCLKSRDYSRFSTSVTDEAFGGHTLCSPLILFFCLALKLHCFVEEALYCDLLLAQLRTMSSR